MRAPDIGKAPTTGGAKAPTLSAKAPTLQGAKAPVLGDVGEHRTPAQRYHSSAHGGSIFGGARRRRRKPDTPDAKDKAEAKTEAPTLAERYHSQSEYNQRRKGAVPATSTSAGGAAGHVTIGS